MMKTKSVRLAAVAAGVVSALLVLASFVPVVHAAPKARVGVLPLRGAGEGPVRAKVSKALKANGFQVVGSQQLESTASGLGVSLDGDAGFKAVARELNISAFVGGELSKKKADLSVRNGADAAVIGEASFTGANPKKIAVDVGADFWRQLGAAVKKGKPPSGAKTKAAIAEEATPADDEAEAPAAEEPPPPPKKEMKKETKKKTVKRAEAEAAEPAEGESPAAEKTAGESKPAAEAEAAPEGSSASSGGSGLPAFTFGVGGRALFRKLDWHQNVQGPLPPYSLSPGPEAALWLEAYPAAFATTHFAANIGLFGGFNYGFGVTSTTTSGARLTTKFRDFLAGAKVRLPLNLLAPYLSLAYGGQSFSLTSSSGPSAVPSVNYKFIRVGAGARVNVGEAGSLDLGAAYLLVTDPGSQAGEIRSAAFFPRAKAYAVDLDASFGYRLTRLLGLRAGVDFRQYGFNMDARMSDTIIAGGATDRYITVWGGVEVIMDGLGGGAAGSDDESDEEEAPAPVAKPKSKGRKKAPPPPEAEEN